MRKLALVIMFSISITGCTSNPIKDRSNDTVSLVAVHVDIGDINAQCNIGRLLNLDNNDQSEMLDYMYRSDRNGKECFLYSTSVEPGRYTLKYFDTFLVTGASSSVTTRYNLPGDGKPYGINNIKKQGVYYLGSFKIKPSKDDQLEIVKSKDITEKQVLSEMLNHRFMQEGEWKEMVKNRLKKLK